MSILETLFGGLFGEDDDVQETVVERPCSNCPSSCSIAPAACSVCQPYKEQMIDAIYWVEHKDELISRYEVTGTTASLGSVTCPHCGGHSEDPYVCEYCGSRLQEGSGKIRVASAADIPNPVLEAQNIIFDRYAAVKDFAGADEAYGLVGALSGVGSKGLLSSIFDALMGDSDENDSKSIGNKMTESEIREMADYYKVSVAEYLTGLDNGAYLTMSNKKTAAAAEEKYSQSSTSSSAGGSLSDLTGMAGAFGLGSLLFGGSSYNYSAARPQQVKPQQVRPQTQSYQTVNNPKPAQYYQTTNNQRPPQNYGNGFPEPPQKPHSGYSGQNGGTGGYTYIGKPTGRPPMPTSPNHNAAPQNTQSAKPARKTEDMHSARKPAANTISQKQEPKAKTQNSVKISSTSKAQEKKKTPQKAQSVNIKRP